MTKREVLNLCKLAEAQGVDADFIPVICGAYTDYMIRVWDVDCIDSEANAVLRFPEAVLFEEFLEKHGYEYVGIHVPWEHEFTDKEKFRRFCGWTE